MTNFDDTLSIIAVGHTDHGKTTLIGRLFYDTTSLLPDRLEDIRRLCASEGKEFDFAYYLDSLEEERKKGLTIDIAHTYFKTKKRRYVIIDAPGHKEFMKNMITGSTQAQAALLLVDISAGVQEQTMRHAYILSLLGIKQIAVIVNKIDLVDYSQQAFEAARKNIADIVKKYIEPIHIIPISAKFGDNIACPCEKLSWFNGPTVLSVLDSFRTQKLEEKDLRFPVQDIYFLAGQQVAVGRVESGVIRQGQEIIILPKQKRAFIKELKKFGEKGLREANCGDCVGIRVEGVSLARGDVITGIQNVSAPDITDFLRARTFWMIEEPYRLDLPLVFRCATQESVCVIEKILHRFDSVSLDIVEDDARMIKSAEIAEVQIKLKTPLVVDQFCKIPEMGRFVLERAGVPVAGGVIL